MANLQKFMLGGLDLKSNHLVRDPMRSSDLLNVTKTISGDIDKRNGYVAVETFAALQESCYYKTLDQDVFVKTDGTIWKPYGGSRQNCSIASLFAGGKVIYTEYLSSLYLTTDDGKSPVVKYDGGDAYLAGLPSPEVIFANTEATISNPGVGYFYRFFYSFKDLRGNVVFGPYKQMESTVNNATITVSTFKISNPYGTFYNKYMLVGYVASLTPNQYTVTSINNFLFTSATNYIVGDVLMIDADEALTINTLSGAKKRFINLTITALTGFKAKSTIQNVIYTAVANGSSGNLITVTYTAGGVAGSEIVTVVGNAISVQIQSGVSTTTQIVAAITASGAASALITGVVQIGQGATAQVSGGPYLFDGGTIQVTFDATQLTGISFNIGATMATLPIDCRLKLRSFRSTLASFGYLECSPVFFTAPGDIAGAGGFVWQIGQPIDNSANDQTSTSIATSPFFYYSMAKLEDVYDVSKQKLRPPLCKYLTSYGDQLVFGNIIGVWDQVNSFSQYANNSLVLYSDFGFSDSGEGHSANDQKIGESYDGVITGLRRCNDLIVITKNNSVFAMDGILDPGAYSLRKIPTNFIGCESHNSILPTEGGLFFHGNDGIYFTDGVNCSKMSQIIDSFFPTTPANGLPIITTSSRSAIDSNRRKYLFYMTDGTTQYCLVYSYEFKEWFIWDSLDMSKGVYQKVNKDLFFAKGTSTYKFNALYSDNGSAINGNYKSNWEDLRNPSVDKKFEYIRIWNLNSVSTTFTLSIQKNWINTDIHTAVCTIPANGSIQKGFEQTNVKAIRFSFTNNIISQNMLITAYEIQYQATQTIDKGN